MKRDSRTLSQSFFVSLAKTQFVNNLNGLDVFLLTKLDVELMNRV